MGRRGTLLTLYVHGLRSCFGLGRRATSKIFPWALAIFAFVPAIIQLGVGAILSGLDQDIEIYKHEDYFTYVRIILVLFCATVAPELVGKDQRNRTLSLYFSRAVSRFDYTFAKFAALTSAMLVLTLGPQLLLFIGNGMAADDLGGYARDNWDLVFPIVAGSLLVSAVIASVGLCIAAYLPRRAYSTAAIVGAFILTLAIAHILMESIDPAVARYFLLASPVAWEGTILWLFRVDPDSRNVLADASLGGWVYLLAVLATIAATFASDAPTLRARVDVTDDDRAQGRLALVRQRRRGQRDVVHGVARDHRPARAERRRQEHGAAHALGLSEAVGGRGHRARRARRGGTPRSTGASGSCPSASRSTARSRATSSCGSTRGSRASPTPTGRPERRSALVDLEDAADRSTGGYSKGMKQRIKVAAALVHDPAVLLLDEPFNGADPRQRLHMIELFRRLAADGRTIIFSSHILEEVERLAERVLVVVGGRLAASGDFREIRRLMTDRPHTFTAPHVRRPAARRCPRRPRERRSASSLGDGRLTVRTSQLGAFALAIPTIARSCDVTLRELRPTDESLEDVFAYLVNR